MSMKAGAAPGRECTAGADGSDDTAAVSSSSADDRDNGASSSEQEELVERCPDRRLSGGSIVCLEAVMGRSQQRRLKQRPSTPACNNVVVVLCDADML